MKTDKLIQELNKLIAQGLTFATVQAAFAKTEEQTNPKIAGYRATALDMHHRDGELEVDENAIVSAGDDSGAYVQAWVWVGDEDLPP